jgi:hypothetical protein
LQLAGRVIGGEDLLQSVGRVPGERVAGAQEQHPVRPGLVDPAAAAALDLLGQVLPGLGHGLVAEVDEVEVINGDGSARKPHPQRFPERRRGVDRDDVDAEPPLKWSGEEPVSDAFVVPAVNDAQDLAGVEVHDGESHRV